MGYPTDQDFEEAHRRMAPPSTRLISPERFEFAKAQNELHKMRYLYWITIAQTGCVDSMAGLRDGYGNELTVKQLQEVALSYANNFLHHMQEYLDYFGEYLPQLESRQG